MVTRQQLRVGATWARKIVTAYVEDPHSGRSIARAGESCTSDPIPSRRSR